MADLTCKVCGLTRPEDVALCHRLGVDFTGFIFAARSARYVEPSSVAGFPDGPSRKVGVFVNAGLEEIRAITKTARLDFIQLHGGEDPEFCRALGREQVIKVLWPERLTREELVQEMERFAPVVSFFLLDAGNDWGGSGKRLECSRLENLRPPRPWLLAGGIGPLTVAEAVGRCHPAGVDANSALESEPGIKDHDRVTNFVNKVRTLQP